MVGAGTGAVTRELAPLCREVVAYEVDPRMADALEPVARESPNIRVVRGDILRAAPPAEPFAVVGNIPFTVTAGVVGWCLGAEHLRSAILLTQWEYVRKRTGDYGRWSLLTVLTWPLYEWRLLGRVSRPAFRPVPAVDGGILRLEQRASPLLPQRSLPAYEDLVRLGFSGVGGSPAASLRRRHSSAAVNGALRAAGVGPATVVGLVPPDAWITIFRGLRDRG